MPIYLYECPIHGQFDTTVRADQATCPRDGCGMSSVRRYSLRINAEAARHRGRWDPVVGEYVENESQFRSLLHQGQDREAARLGMDVKLVEVDARDHAANAELHGEPLDERMAVIENTHRANFDNRPR